MNRLPVRAVDPLFPAADLVYMGPTADGGVIYCTGYGRMLDQEGRLLAQLVPPPQQLVAARVSPDCQSAVFFEHVVGTSDTIVHVMVGPDCFRFETDVVSSDYGTIYMGNCSICDDGAVFGAVDSHVVAVAPAVGPRTQSVICTVELFPPAADGVSPYFIVNFDLVQIGPNRYRYAAVADSDGVILHDPLADGSMRVIHGEISLPTALGLQPQFTVTDLPAPFGTPPPGMTYDVNDPDSTRVAVSSTTVAVSNHHYNGGEGYFSVWDVATNELMWRLSPPQDSDLAFIEGVLLSPHPFVAVLGTNRELRVYWPNGDPYGSVTLEVDDGVINEFDAGVPTADGYALVVSGQFSALIDVLQPLRKMLIMIMASRRRRRGVPLLPRLPHIPAELWTLIFKEM